MLGYVSFHSFFLFALFATSVYSIVNLCTNFPKHDLFYHFLHHNLDYIILGVYFHNGKYLKVQFLSARKVFLFNMLFS